jgi:hypothetical protein
MHELGHNLGLDHGGDDDKNYKPNYLSIMNYQFQYSGVAHRDVDGTVKFTYDYSRFGPDSDPSNLLPVLDEDHLNETTGLGTPAVPVGANVLNYLTVFVCGPGNPPPGNPLMPIKHIGQPIDWDCDAPDPNTQTDVPVDVNGDGQITLLSPYDDWAHLVYKGGRIGQFGNAILPGSTRNTEATPEELRRYADFWAAQQQQPATDAIAPATTAALLAPPNAAGWHNHDVAVTLSATDNPGGSGVKQITYSASGAQLIAGTNVNGDSASFAVNTEGTTTVSFFATDNAGNIEAAHSFSIRLDKTPPTIIGVRSPNPNANDWNNSSVTITFQCSDGLSGLAAGSPPPPTIVSTQGAGQSVKGTCTDLAGNVASLTVSAINIDTTPPTLNAVLVPPPPANGWNNTPVTVSFVATDLLSGVATVSSPVTVSSEGSAQIVIGSATDKAGNMSRIETILNIDTTPPSITLSPNASTLWPPNGSMTPVLFSGAVTDATSGVDGSSIRFVVTDEYGIVQPSGNVTIAANGTYSFIVPLEASRLGSDWDGRLYTITVTAQDNAGNQASRPTTVTVPHDQGR